MILIRPIRPEDDAAIAAIVRETLNSFGACGDGFAGADAELEGMCRAYHRPGHRYFVLEEAGRIVGGGGIGVLEGASRDTCELRKMYFLPEARGQGVGTRLLASCLRIARELGYRVCYLETLQTMHAARKLYRSFGFEKLDQPIGSTGHFGCDSWHQRVLAGSWPRDGEESFPPATFSRLRKADAQLVVDRFNDSIREFLPPAHAFERGGGEALRAGSDRKGAAYFTLGEEGAIVAGVGYEPFGEDSFCRLHRLFVAPERRGEGMGERLLANALAHAWRDGSVGCVLETLEGMAAARRLYERFGFRTPDPALPGLGDDGHHQALSLDFSSF